MAHYILNDDGSITKQKKKKNIVDKTLDVGKAVFNLPTTILKGTYNTGKQAVNEVLDDGYQVGDISKIGLKTIGNAATNVAHGTGKALENFYDFSLNASTNINTNANQLFGIQNKKEAELERKRAQNIIKRDLTTDIENKLGWDDELRTQWEKGSLIKRDNLGGKIAQGVGEMVPQILIGNKLGGTDAQWKALNFGEKIVASAPTNLGIGITSYGGGLEEAYSEGANTSQANKYALGSALVEMGTEWLTDGVPGLPQTGAFDKFTDKALDKTSNSMAKFLLKQGFTFLGEGGEEALSEMIKPYLQNATYTKGKQINWNDVFESFVVGGLVGDILELPGNLSNYHADVNALKEEFNNELARENPSNSINIPTAENVSQNGLNVPTNANVNTNQNNNISLPTVENTNPLENLQEFNKRQQEIRNQQVQEETSERLNTLEEQLEKQGNRILEESESQREAMIESFKEYLEEHNITNPTQQDINDSITDIMSYDNDLDFADTARAEQLYNKYVKEYMQENGIPFNNGNSLKQSQLDIIKKSNPMQDDYHTGIRNVEDIKTLEETLNDSDYMDYDEFNPDLTRQDIENAIKSGMITVYSSYPIENGVFVSPSKMEAESYSGNGKIYSKQVPINDIAWIDPTQGQYAKVQSNIPTARDFNRVNLPTVENKSLFLNDYTEKSANQILQNERHEIIHNEAQLDYMIDEALNTQKNKALHLGIIDNTTIVKIKEKIKNLPTDRQDYLQNNDYDLVINQSEIRHLKDDKVKLTNEEIHDYVKKLPSLISECDDVIYSKNEKDEGLQFKKKFEDGTYYSFDIVSNKKHTLTAKTIFMLKQDYEHKKRSISLPNNSSNELLDNTSETSRLSASLYDNNITNRTKSQIAPLPSQYNMQQNEKKIPTKQDFESKSNKVSMPMAKADDVLRIASKDIAKQINNTGGFDLKQRSWVETSTESDILKDKVYIDDLDQGMIKYVVQSNKKSLDTANNHLETYGYDKTLDYVKNIMQSDKLPSASDVALMQRMIQEASKRGDYETVQDLIMDTAIVGTDLGQATQALSIIQKLTPEGQLKMYTKLVQRAKARGEKSFQNVEITPEMVQNILEAYDKNGTYDQDDLNARVEKFKQDIVDQMKSTAGEKADAFRYLAMLGNPKTHLRNMISNIAMTGTIKVKNAMARTLETILPVQNRTKTWKKASNDIKAFSKQTANDMKGIITGENKYNEKSAIESKKKIFKSKILEWLSKWNGNLLEAEDWFFSKRAFQSTLQEYLTANGINTYEDIQNNLELVEKAKLYAVEQAEIATFRQYSKLASEINRIERNNKLAKYPLKAVIPFKKTPINVAKAGAKYSPLGLIKSISYDVFQLKRGNINASQFIDNLSQGLTGTSLTLLGYALAKAGILSGSGDDDKEAKYDSQLGKQNYSLNIGGNSYSISWLSPVAMPLLVGSNAYEKLEEGEGWNPDVVADTLAETLDPLSEMSFVSSLTDVLTSYNTGSAQMIKDIGTTAGQSYVMQFFPTLFSQMASTLDDKKRSTKVSNNSTFKIGEETVRKIMYKIPGLRNQLEVATDIWGNEKEQSSNILERAFESFLAPYSKTKDISTDLDKEIKRVYNETGNQKVVPGIPYAYTKYDKETYKMSANEYTKFKKTYGQTANNTLNSLINSDSYQNASDEDKAKMIENVYEYARAKANEEYFDSNDIEYSNQLLDKVDTLHDRYGISANTYFANKNEYDYAYQNPDKYSVIKQITSYDKYTTYKEKINDIRNNTTNDKAETIKYINSLSMSIPQKAMFIKQYYKSFTNYDKDIIKYINNQKLTVKEKEQILTQLGFTVRNGRVY